MADHTQCHRDIDQLLAEVERLRTALRLCAAAGREADEALIYRTEKIQWALECAEFGCHEQETDIP